MTLKGYGIIWVVLAVLCFLSVYGHSESAKQDGRTTFLSHCGNCHGRDGEGFLMVYPPLTGSSYFNRDISRLPCIIRNGLEGEIEVGGKTFNGVMPGNERLSEKELELLMNYLIERWGGSDRQRITVQKWLHACSNNQ